MRFCCAQYPNARRDFALAIAPVVYHVCSAPIFDDDERPVFPEYERGLDIALLAGVTVRRDRKKTSPLQGVLPLACLPARDLEELHRSQALTDDPGEGKFLGPQFAAADEDPMRTQVLTQMGFGEAAAAWLESRKPYLSPKTIYDYQGYIHILTKKFGMFRLTEIDGDLLRKYQRERMGEGCGPIGINHECGVMQQMLKRVGRWAEIDYQPLPVPKTQPGRILSETEKQRLFRIASSQPEWQAAYLFAVLSVNTTAGPKEVAVLRLKDVDLQNRWMTVQPEAQKISIACASSA